MPRFLCPFDVKLNDSPLTIVQPDLLVICNKNKLDGKRCNGAPDFIIEIVSPGNPADDYIRKLYYYKNADVREYWIQVSIWSIPVRYRRPVRGIRRPMRPIFHMMMWKRQPCLQSRC